MRPLSTLHGIAILLFLLVFCTLAFAADTPLQQAELAGLYPAAQQPAAPAAAEAPVVPEIAAKADELTHQYRMQQETNKIYEIGILSLLALVSLFLVLRFLSAQSRNSGPQIVNATGLICIIFGTILLVIMAHSDQQLTASMGILGAVAGYLFRSMHGGTAGAPAAPEHRDS
jgi:hypothetical protein